MTDPIPIHRGDPLWEWDEAPAQWAFRGVSARDGLVLLDDPRRVRIGPKPLAPPAAWSRPSLGTRLRRWWAGVMR